MQNVYHGFSVRSWTENYAKTYLHIDPMGIILMEVGKNVTYPTYKSTTSIYDYQLKGREVEYLVLTTKEPNEYRIIDDQFDKIVKFDGGIVTTKEDDVYPNYFGKVPAIVISDILKPNTEFYTSPDHEIIEIADEFLRESSVKSIFKLKHGYPKSWQYASVCQTCKGTGLKGGDDCGTCNGSGRAVVNDSSEVITLPYPDDGQTTITPNVAGYVSPDIAGWDKMSDELRLLENQMHNTYWGVEPLQQTNGQNPTKTATEIVDNNQPIYARLSKLSKWAEGIEKFITDYVGQFYYTASYKGCSISYGTRYGIEGPDAIWTKYQDARSKGAPDSVLDSLLLEYYESKYSTNNMELAKQVKLMKVEPFIHLTTLQAKDIVVSQLDYNKKLYYLEWLNTLPDNEVLIKSTANLIESLNNYAATKPIVQPILKP